MSELDEAFTLANEVHRDDYFDDSQFAFNYLTLECLGSFSSDGAIWAASFDACLGDEWFENHEIHKYATAHRAATPEQAISGAAKKFYKLTQVVRESKTGK